jgi:diaminohydroxyphosphoribosylaminopyrimidine deaminase/5-amino-6-(5-phosphoribosylamino)uracil reductase
MCDNSWEIDLFWMRRALALARLGLGKTSPNPCVGAVIVREGELLGEGFHQRAGGPHAELEALQNARSKGKTVEGATLYVTLEPCSTYGRTPPCTEAIVAARLKRVVVACQDPNPNHRGRGIILLREAGLEVDCGLLAEESAWMNRGFFRWVTQGLPWVVAKLALSLDGKIDTRAGDSRWLTGPKARRLAHRLRAESDAILVGAETARRDNPSLTVRGGENSRQVSCPWRVIVTRSGRLPPGLKVFQDPYREKTLVFQNYPLREVLRRLAERGVARVLIEGGSLLLQSALKERLVDEVACFLAPVVLGTRRPAGINPGRWSPWLQEPRWSRVGEDLFATGLLSPLWIPDFVSEKSR